MLARHILIVEENKEARQTMKDMFADTHYDVDATSSAAYAIAKIVQGNAPVVLLGDEFEELISANDVIALMRRCNKHLKIILVSDDTSLEVLKKMREEGIFYHATKPHTEADAEELVAAVTCAITTN